MMLVTGLEVCGDVGGVVDGVVEAGDDTTVGELDGA